MSSQIFKFRTPGSVPYYDPNDTYFPASQSCGTNPAIGQQLWWNGYWAMGQTSISLPAL